MKAINEIAKLAERLRHTEKTIKALLEGAEILQQRAKRLQKEYQRKVDEQSPAKG